MVGLLILLLLNPGQHLAETLVLDDGRVADALQLVEGRRANGAVYAPQMQSSVCTKNLSDGSRPKLFSHPPTPPRCGSGRCSLQDRSTCARWMVGRRSPQNPWISRLTLPP